jgi:zinc transporter 1/2/3
MLALTYALTTPIGIAIGIAVRYSLNTNSVPMLMTTGILDAISAGTLIFLALGDHMNALKSQGGWLRVQRIPIQLACFASFFIGAAVLLVLALWA